MRSGGASGAAARFVTGWRAGAFPADLVAFFCLFAMVPLLSDRDAFACPIISRVPDGLILSRTARYRFLVLIDNPLPKCYSHPHVGADMIFMRRDLEEREAQALAPDRKSTRLNSSHQL